MWTNNSSATKESKMDDYEVTCSIQLLVGVFTFIQNGPDGFLSAGVHFVDDL